VGTLSCMSPVSLIPIFVLFLLACGVIYLLLQVTKINVPKDRFESIDGLRGILAFSVFIHHSTVWFYFLRGNKWALPYSVYAYLGINSVAMFFMITAFLFYSKLLSAKKKGIDWRRLYINRVYRIMPLYVFAVLVLFLIAGFESHFVLREAPLRLFSEFFKWLIFIQNNINRINGTYIILAGVVWSLAFEWLFYCSLAWIGKVVFHLKIPIKILIVTGLVFSAFLLIILNFYPYGIVRRICPFTGGIMAAFLVRNDQVRKYCSSTWASFLLLILIYEILLFYPDITAPIPFICICLIFTIIAAGNDVFGLLTSKLLKYLGMISYSIYLLHGMLLFTCFRFVIGFKKASELSQLEHLLVVCFCTISLILLCTLTYLFIEKPALRKKSNTHRLPKKIPSKSGCIIIEQEDSH